MKHIKNRYFLVLDTLNITLIPFLALVLRVNPHDFTKFITVELMLYIFCSVMLKLPIFCFFSLYRRFWKYASVDEILSIIWAVSSSTAILALLVFLERAIDVIPGGVVPRSLPFIDGLLTFAAVGGIRFSIRVLASRKVRLHQHHPQNKPTLIAGAGEAGVMVLKSIMASSSHSREVLGFVDDFQKVKTRISGLSVLGNLDAIPKIVSEYDIDEVIIAIPSAEGKTNKRILDLCEKAEVITKIVPSLSEIVDGSVNVNQIRDVQIADLLRRDPVKVDYENISKMINNKRILVSGAGGSIGSELCRQIAKCGPAKLVLLGHGENSLFNIQNELISTNPQLSLKVVVADIRDKNRLDHIFNKLKPNRVFHAAAHKHVPLMEANIEEAVMNNVMGTRNLVQVAEKHEVEGFVTISTDKAVNPTNVMGATKCVTESVVHAAGLRTGKPYVCVRFGNVLGSRGSVIPTFKQQIAEGGPITVTHPEMTRFFMTIPEASQLVLQAGAMGEKEEVFVLDMGEPVKIVDLAKDLIELSGKKIGDDIEIKFTGLRPGEKMYEELFGGEESPIRTEHKKIFRSPKTPLEDEKLDEVIDEMLDAASQGQSEIVRGYLKNLVPGYNPT